MNKSCLASAFVISTVAMICGAQAEGEGAACKAALKAPVTFRISHQNSPTSPIHPPLEQIATALDAQTGGMLKAAVFPSAQLGGEMQVLEQAALGQNVIFYATAGALATVGVPEFSILNGPFLTESLAGAQKLADSAVIDKMKTKLAAKGGLRVLALNWFDSPRSILGHKAYVKPGDLAGIKMRVPEAPAYMKTFRLLKTAPQALPFSELYLALQQGVVAAAEGGIDGMANANLMEVAKTVTVTDHFRLFYGFTMSEAQYTALPEPCRALMVNEFTAKGLAYSSQMDDITAKRIAALKAKNVTFVEADRDAYRKATEDFYTQFPEWPAGLLNDVRAAMR